MQQEDNKKKQRWEYLKIQGIDLYFLVFFLFLF